MLALILVRHAECYKNIRDEHGGGGDALTETGQKELVSLGQDIERIATHHKVNLDQVLYSPSVIQIAQTAEYLAKYLNTLLIEDKRIKPLDIGVIAGLSRAEALRRFPDASFRLEQWRSGNLEIRDLSLPGAEQFDDLWNRGNTFIEEIERSGKSSLVVSSRSILILLLNILLGRNPFIDGQYHPWNISCGSITCFLHNKLWKLMYTKGIETFDGKILRSSG